MIPISYYKGVRPYFPILSARECDVVDQIYFAAHAFFSTEFILLFIFLFFIESFPFFFFYFIQGILYKA